MTDYTEGFRKVPTKFEAGLTAYESFALDVGKLVIFSLGVTLLFRGVGWIASKAIGPIPVRPVSPNETAGGDTCSTS